MDCRKLLVNLGVGTLVALPMTLVNAEMAGANRRPLIIHNHTGVEIAELYISDVSSPVWEKPNVLRYGNTIKPDGIFELKISFDEGNCHYDIRAKDVNGNEVPAGGLGRFDLCRHDRVSLTPISNSTVAFTP